MYLLTGLQPHCLTVYFDNVTFPQALREVSRISLVNEDICGHLPEGDRFPLRECDIVELLIYIELD